jgi:hypothetical protein
MNLPETVIISGSSITNDHAWPTWATWVRKSYNFKNVIDLSMRGAGNEVILTKTIDRARSTPGKVFLIVQLTSVDKWDWYVPDPALMKQIQKEKHPGILIQPDDKVGYWCTGSHFPLWKEYYQQHYLSIEHQTFKTLQLIQWFSQLCDSQGWGYQIIFEGPILSVTEQQLNIGALNKEECVQTTLTNNSLCQTIDGLIDYSKIYLPGLIGYACINDLPWFHPKFKSHPGSLIHYYYARDVIYPIFDQLFGPAQNLETLEHEASVFQKLFENL